jgi:para-nitrobenzyl esterase
MPRWASVSALLDEQVAVYPVHGIMPDCGTLVVPNGLIEAFSAGEIVKVPVLEGSNANDGRFDEPTEITFAAGLSTIVAACGPANYDLSNANSFCGGACTYTKETNLYLAGLRVPASVNTNAFDIRLAERVYPLSSFPDPDLANNAPSADEGLAQMFTDYIFACNALDANANLAQFVTVYAYEFNDPLAPPTRSQPAPAKLPNDQYGYPTAAEHGADVPFLFDMYSTNELNADEQEFAATMRSYWANFVSNLDPAKGAAVPAWPSFTAEKKQVQGLVPGTNPAPFETFGKEHFCSMWEPIIAQEQE